jgi:hypothetical protein
MAHLILVALLALALAVPAGAQQRPANPMLPGRACTTPAGVCWAPVTAAPGTPCQCYTGTMWVAGVIREWVWDAPPSR